MNRDEIRTKLIDWMINFVEVPNPELGDWAPCPYARQARIRDNISIRFSDNLVEETHNCLKDLEDNEVVVICFDHNVVSAEDAAAIAEELNSQLMPNDFIILEDHPNIIESINGVRMNFEHCGLFIIQRMSKLKTASDQLKEKGYYESWSQSDIDFVVSWRDHD